MPKRQSRNMVRLIQVFEFEKLTLQKDQQGRVLYPDELEKLYAYNDRNNNIYFTGIRDGFRFQNYVGVIQVGGLTLEILPKADKNQTSDTKDYQKWHNVLLNMLAICRHIKVDAVSDASLQKRQHSLLDLYFKIFLDEVSQLIRRGLIKKYHKQEGNVSALKGRIIFGKQISNNLIHQERMYTEHQIYDHEHLHNQILLKALSVLSIVSTNPFILDHINRIKFDFPNIKEIEITALHFNHLKDNRKTKPYDEAIKIARMIILNYSPDIKSGREHLLALLFDMNKLWEEYIYRMLVRTNSTAFAFSYQNSRKFWEHKTIRPDLVITKKYEDGTEETFVIDTKWKVIDARNPSDEDLKQMFVYNAYWESSKSMLLYPKTFEYTEKFGSYHKGLPGAHHCKLGFVHVIDSTGKLDMNIGWEVLKKLE
jgi:5-methylcytosine-specific restriction enzyme subunit McrC